MESRDDESVAVILAGGRSSRMGAPKEEVVLSDGRPMIAHVIAALEPLDMPIHVACAPSPGTFLRGLGLPLIEDEETHQGPLAAIARALNATGARRVLAVCCDQPLVPSGLLMRIAREANGDMPTFFQDNAGTAYDPFPGVFPRSSHAGLKAFLASGGRSPRRWISTTTCQWIAITPDEWRTLVSLNTMEDLRAAGLA